MEDWKSGDDCFVIRFGDILKGKMIGSNSNNYLIVQINSAGGTLVMCHLRSLMFTGQKENVLRNYWKEENLNMKLKF